MEHKLLKERHDELLKVNHRWDESYHQLEAEFREYKKGAKRAQDELSDHLYRVKGRLGEVEEELSRMKAELRKKGRSSPMESGQSPGDHEWQHRCRQLKQQLKDMQSLNEQLREQNHRLKEENKSLEQRLSLGGGHSGAQVKQMKEEIDYLRHQAEIYKEDFRAERKDREKLKDRLENSKIKLDTETANLKLQIDTLRRERDQLKKDRDTYRAQANLKAVREKALVDNYMFGKGYVSRGVNGSSNSEPTSLSNSRPDSPGADDHSDRVYNGYQGNGELPPPYLGKGSHKCQKCYRKFESKRELQDHKIRCLI